MQCGIWETVLCIYIERGWWVKCLSKCREISRDFVGDFEKWRNCIDKRQRNRSQAHSMNLKTVVCDTVKPVCNDHLYNIIHYL